MSAEITILVVDDDEDIRDMLTEYLQDHDYKVLVAEDGDGRGCCRAGHDGTLRWQ